MSAADLAAALSDAGGTAAPRARSAQLLGLLLDELARGAAALALPRSGYPDPVVVVFAATSGALVAVCPVDPGVRMDPGRVGERAWALTAATVGGLVHAVDPGPAAGPEALQLQAGRLAGWLALALPARNGDAELAALAYEEQSGGVDRLRTSGFAFPAAALAGVEDLRRSPLAPDLATAEAVARLGGRPADGASVDEHGDALTALIDHGARSTRPHEDEDPARRIARRILQRLNGMGKWGGYHTEFVHLPRGFAGNERALAQEVGEALIAAGLLCEKPSVGQRHVFLNPRRAADIHALIADGHEPPDLRLPRRPR